ncbi:MAG: phosphatidate cytidylyltransferase [Treponema sp.]|nr:phosphatidate cytidylyltransferase [Treponema sp.]
MGKVLPRLFTFFVGVPLFVGLVFFDVLHHLPLHVVIVLFSAIAANEMNNLLGTKFKTQPKPLVIVMTTLTTLSAALSVILFSDSAESLVVSNALMNYVFMGAIMVCLAYEVFSLKTFENSNSRIVTSAFTIIYCGFFSAFILRMTSVEHSKMILAVYLAMVFFCDSLAWFFGNLFGKNNKGFVKASPNKSIAGFCGGFFGSILIGVIAHFFWIEDSIFGADTTTDLLKVVVLGFLTAFAAIVGDLVESVFKRSAEIKDSGHLIPGRGGMLDSLDSIVFAAPIYYLAYTLLF